MHLLHLFDSVDELLVQFTLVKIIRGYEFEMVYQFFEGLHPIMTLRMCDTRLLVASETRVSSEVTRAVLNPSLRRLPTVGWKARDEV